jgi:hypothetical protein
MVPGYALKEPRRMCGRKERRIHKRWKVSGGLLPPGGVSKWILARKAGWVRARTVVVDQDLPLACRLLLLI